MHASVVANRAYIPNSGPADDGARPAAGEAASDDVLVKATVIPSRVNEEARRGQRLPTVRLWRVTALPLLHDVGMQRANSASAAWSASRHYLRAHPSSWRQSPRTPPLPWSQAVMPDVSAAGS